MATLLVPVFGKKKIIDDTDEKPDEVDIDCEGTIDSKIVSVLESAFFCNLIDIVHIEDGRDDHYAKQDKVENEIERIRTDEDIDQRDDKNTRQNGEENRIDNL